MKKRYLLLIIVIAIIILFFPHGNYAFYFSPVEIFKNTNPKIINFGDVMFDRGVRNIMENKGRDPFEHIKKDINLISDYDLKIVNLEGPIVVMNRSLCQQKAYNFQFATNTVDKLKEVGINMVNIANNHSYDCYMVGFESTKKYLNDAGILFMGDSDYEKSFVLKEIRGKKFAFVGIDETVQVIPVSGFYKVIEKLKRENDYVVVNIHWGKEYELHSVDSQRQIAHKLIDSGADIIFGSHPHVREELEIYKNKAIFYSLGNFVFDQNFGDTTIGLGVGAEFKETEIQFEIFPFNIKVFAPEFMKGSERDDFCTNYLKNIENNNCIFNIKL